MAAVRKKPVTVWSVGSVGRAHRSHRWGHWFESSTDHHQPSEAEKLSRVFSWLNEFVCDSCSVQQEAPCCTLSTCKGSAAGRYHMILIIFSRFRPIDHCLGSAQNCCSCNPRKTIDLHGYRSEYEMEFVRRAVSACVCFLLL